MPSFSLKRGISVSFQAINHLKPGPKQLGSLIILDLHAQDISNFGNGMAWLLLSLRLQHPGEPPPRRRVKPPDIMPVLANDVQALSHSPLAHSSSKAFRLSHSSLLSIINITIYSSRIILSSTCLSIRHLHQPQLLPYLKTSPTIDFRNHPSHRSLPNTRSHQASSSAAFPNQPTGAPSPTPNDQREASIQRLTSSISPIRDLHSRGDK
jgi:hypothetical protein